MSNHCRANTKLLGRFRTCCCRILCTSRLELETIAKPITILALASNTRDTTVCPPTFVSRDSGTVLAMIFEMIHTALRHSMGSALVVDVLKCVETIARRPWRTPVTLAKCERYTGRGGVVNTSMYIYGQECVSLQHDYNAVVVLNARRLPQRVSGALGYAR